MLENGSSFSQRCCQIKTKNGNGYEDNQEKVGARSRRKRKQTTQIERIIPSHNKGGFLPSLWPLLGAIGSVV